MSAPSLLALHLASVVERQFGGCVVWPNSQRHQVAHALDQGMLEYQAQVERYAREQAEHLRVRQETLRADYERQ